MGFLHSRCFVGLSEPSPIQREVSWMTRALRKKRFRVDKQGWSGWTLMANCVWMSCFYSLWLKRSENFRPPKASRQSRFNHYVVRLALSASSTGKTSSALTCNVIIPASSSSAALEPSFNHQRYFNNWNVGWNRRAWASGAESRMGQWLESQLRAWGWPGPRTILT